METQLQCKKIAVLGYGGRGRIYSDFAKFNPDKFQLVAVIETNPVKIEAAKWNYPNAQVFSDYHDFIEAKIEADIVAICTQDEQHKEHAIAMMEAGYDLLLEKPIATRKKDCEEIYAVSKKYGRKVIVCHVLRYSLFYDGIKKAIDDGKLGEVVTIHASENVGFYHQAHSFVRGPWRNETQSCPMILAKCCHDMDIIRYLMGEECISVNSYGGLHYFNEKNAPEGCTEYCSDCKYTDCMYKAQKLYLYPAGKWCAGYFTHGEWTDENILKCLEKTQYDKCVFKNDNDVVDHQVTIMQFANGKTACHTMCGFSAECYRDIKIYGTKAELYGRMEDNAFEIRNFGGEVEKVSLDISAANVGAHNGSDYFMMDSIHKIMNGVKANGVTYLDVSIESHFMSFAAEESRLNQGKTVNIEK